jgi:hypothetical protein
MGFVGESALDLAGNMGATFHSSRNEEPSLFRSIMCAPISGEGSGMGLLLQRRTLYPQYCMMSFEKTELLDPSSSNILGMRRFLASGSVAFLVVGGGAYNTAWPHDVLPGVPITVFRRRRPDSPSIVYIDITTFGPAPAWICSDKQRKIYSLPTRNFIMGGIDRLRPVLTGLKNEDDRATQALLCQSRGVKARLPCSSCRADEGSSSLYSTSRLVKSQMDSNS